MKQLYDLELGNEYLILYKHALKIKPDGVAQHAHEVLTRSFYPDGDLKYYHGKIPETLNAIKPKDITNLILYFTEGGMDLEDILNNIKIKKASFKLIK